MYAAYSARNPTCVPTMRYRRAAVPGASYFFTLITHRRQRLFSDEDNVARWHRAVAKVQRKWPFIVVHGHTPEPNVHIDKRRIGVDTGAYATGRLSAVRLEGDNVRVLTT